MCLSTAFQLIGWGLWPYRCCLCLYSCAQHLRLPALNMHFWILFPWWSFPAPPRRTLFAFCLFRALLVTCGGLKPPVAAGGTALLPWTRGTCMWAASCCLCLFWRRTTSRLLRFLSLLRSLICCSFKFSPGGLDWRWSLVESETVSVCSLRLWLLSDRR